MIDALSQPTEGSGGDCLMPAQPADPAIVFETAARASVSKAGGDDKRGKRIGGGGGGGGGNWLAVKFPSSYSEVLTDNKQCTLCLLSSPGFRSPFIILAQPQHMFDFYWVEAVETEKETAAAAANLWEVTVDG